LGRGTPDERFPGLGGCVPPCADGSKIPDDLCDTQDDEEHEYRKKGPRQAIPLGAKHELGTSDGAQDADEGQLSEG
jgi:hypothetical protein